MWIPSACYTFFSWAGWTGFPDPDRFCLFTNLFPIYLWYELNDEFLVTSFFFLFDWVHYEKEKLLPLDANTKFYKKSLQNLFPWWFCLFIIIHKFSSFLKGNELHNFFSFRYFVISCGFSFWLGLLSLKKNSYSVTQIQKFKDLKVEKFACRNFCDRNFHENLFSQIWKNIAKFANICFREIFQNYEVREIYHKNSLIWKMKNSCMHQCIKETFLQSVDYTLCLWRQI